MIVFLFFILLQILYAKDVDQRSSTFEKSISIGKEYQRRTKMLLLRSAIYKHQIQVKVEDPGIVDGLLELVNEQTFKKKAFLSQCQQRDLAQVGVEMSVEPGNSRSAPR